MDEVIPIYSEKTCVEPLQRGETVLVRGYGNSMTPLLQSGTVIKIRPLEQGEIPRKGDVVIAKVNGRIYCHRVTGIRKYGRPQLASLVQVQISNNHGHINGWTTLDKVYGKWVKEYGEH